MCVCVCSSGGEGRVLSHDHDRIVTCKNRKRGLNFGTTAPKCSPSFNHVLIESGVFFKVCIYVCGYYALTISFFFWRKSLCEDNIKVGANQVFFRIFSSLSFGKQEVFVSI